MLCVLTLLGLLGSAMTALKQKEKFAHLNNIVWLILQNHGHDDQFDRAINQACYDVPI